MNPWSWYTDPDQLRLERDRIFAAAWQYVGHAGQAPEPGSYFAAEAAHVPVVVVRDGAGELAAFLNVCRHRGHPVTAGSGRRETLQCPYHAWTYGLDGRLLAAPRADREADFERSEVRLRPLALETWGPFVFVSPAPDPAPLAEALGPVPSQVAELLDVDALDFRLRLDFELAANWKIVCENFLECYHCPVVHPGFSGLVDVSPDSYRLELDGLTSSQFGATRAAVDGEVARAQFHFVWPNVGINIFPGRPNLSIGPIVPVAPDRTARFLDYFFAPDEDEAWIREFLAFDDQVGREDRALVEGVQRGVSSGLIERGRLLPESERLVAEFQRLTAQALASG